MVEGHVGAQLRFLGGHLHLRLRAFGLSHCGEPLRVSDVRLRARLDHGELRLDASLLSLQRSLVAFDQDAVLLDGDVGLLHADVGNGRLALDQRGVRTGLGVDDPRLGGFALDLRLVGVEHDLLSVDLFSVRLDLSLEHLDLVAQNVGLDLSALHLGAVDVGLRLQRFDHGRVRLHFLSVQLAARHLGFDLSLEHLDLRQLCLDQRVEHLRADLVAVHASIEQRHLRVVDVDLRLDLEPGGFEQTLSLIQEQVHVHVLGGDRLRACKAHVLDLPLRDLDGQLAVQAQLLDGEVLAQLIDTRSLHTRRHGEATHRELFGHRVQLAFCGQVFALGCARPHGLFHGCRDARAAVPELAQLDNHVVDDLGVVGRLRPLEDARQRRTDELGRCGVERRQRQPQEIRHGDFRQRGRGRDNQSRHVRHHHVADRRLGGDLRGSSPRRRVRDVQRADRRDEVGDRQVGDGRNRVERRRVRDVRRDRPERRGGDVRQVQVDIDRRINVGQRRRVAGVEVQIDVAKGRNSVHSRRLQFAGGLDRRANPLIDELFYMVNCTVCLGESTTRSHIQILRVDTAMSTVASWTSKSAPSTFEIVKRQYRPQRPLPGVTRLFRGAFASRASRR